MMKRLLADRMAFLAVCFLVLLIVLGIFAPVIAPFDPDMVNITNKLAFPSSVHWFGTDYLGRDVLSRLIYGIRTTLGLALLTMLLTVIIGTFLGVVAGYFQGKVDQIIMFIIQSMQAFPNELMIIIVIGLLGPSMTNLIIGSVLVHWAWYTRMIRTIVMQFRFQPYIQFARISGQSFWQIFKRHIWPNMLPELLVLTTLDTGWSILNISTMSFLGLGVQAPQSEWGVMLAQAKNVMTTQPSQMFAPGFAILLTVASLNYLGDFFRDSLHPKYVDKLDKS
ncbi:ABC transporter permease subunit [Carnobacteriaceae bacterium zg-ZUI252]|nr:ABC transporter permease subunit [Carnobacteriaceae bacterium zg-ZUI252]MBS4770344.1 ABC transporter permease subunit [Carnobacteriaceae bacterium zg-ZUI240]